MNEKIINVDFTRPDDRWLKKARAARDAEDMPRALQLYRTVLEKEPANWEAGLEYAVLLYRCCCWRSSLRECYRLLGWFPGEEKLYGLIYRNLIPLDMTENARYAYERYMMYLYRNPEGGLNLGDSEPPIPEKPSRKRYDRLLARASRCMEKGDLDKANRLLMHACTGAFPREDTLRTLLEANLMEQMGMEEEAAAVVDGLVQQQALDACQAVALMHMMYRLRGAAYAGNLLLYAAGAAQSGSEVYETTRVCIVQEHPELADSMLADILQDTPFRLDALYDRAVISLHMGDLNAASQLITLCWQLDPGDGDVDFLYRLINEARQENVTAHDLLRLPIVLYGAAASPGHAVALMNYRKLAALSQPPEVLREVMGYKPQCRFLDCVRSMDAALKQYYLTIAAGQEPAGEEALLRMLLLFADPDEQMLDTILKRLACLGAEGEAAAVAEGRLTTVTLPPREPDTAPDAE